jgi:hypothetical protein
MLHLLGYILASKFLDHLWLQRSNVIVGSEALKKVIMRSSTVLDKTL